LQKELFQRYSMKIYSMNKIIIYTLLSWVFLLSSCTQKEVIQWPVEEKNTPWQDIIKTYKNEKEGFKIEYPSYFTVTEYPERRSVWFWNGTCEANNQLCFMGIRSIDISVSENTEDETLDSIEKRWKNCPNIKRLNIYQLPENFNNAELLETLRCKFEEVPKQAPGGYSYILLKNDKIFTIDFLQDDWYIPALDPVALNIVSVENDDYDPLGDMMMRTFRFTD